MIRFCMAMSRGKICAKLLAWTKAGGHWSATCMCGLQRRACTGEALELDALAEAGKL